MFSISSAFSAFSLLSVFLSTLGVFLHCSEPISQEDQELLFRATRSYQARKFTQSQRLLERLTRKHEDWTAAIILKGKILYFTREFSRAEKQFRIALETDPHHPYARQWLARSIATDPGRTREVVDVLRRILQRNPDDFTAHYLMARCYSRLERPEASIRHFQEALKGKRLMQKSHGQLGHLFQSLGLQGRAQKHLNRLQRSGNNASTRGKATGEKR